MKSKIIERKKYKILKKHELQNFTTSFNFYIFYYFIIYIFIIINL